MLTKHLAWPMLLLGLVLLLAGFHFNQLVMILWGSVATTYGVAIHNKTVRIVRQHYEKHREII